jgi:8-oxo-dGTP diphosphatase
LEHHALRWIHASSLASVPWLPADLELLPALRTLLAR